MQNAYKKPDALKLFIRSIFRIAYHKENTGWFNTDYVEKNEGSLFYFQNRSL